MFGIIDTASPPPDSVALASLSALNVNPYPSAKIMSLLPLMSAARIPAVFSAPLTVTLSPTLRPWPRATTCMSESPLVVSNPSDASRNLGISLFSRTAYDVAVENSARCSVNVKSRSWSAVHVREFCDKNNEPIEGCLTTLASVDPSSRSPARATYTL